MILAINIKSEKMKKGKKIQKFNFNFKRHKKRYYDRIVHLRVSLDFVAPVE